MSDHRGSNRSPRRESASSAPTRLKVPDPDEIGLPRAQRSYMVPLAIAIAVFVVIILVRMAWG